MDLSSHILTNTLSQDNNQRLKAEEDLFSYKQSQPDNFIKSIGDCCLHQDYVIRQIAIMHFCKFFSNGNDQIFNSQWVLISEETKDYIKQQILIIIQKETKALLKKWAKELFRELIFNLWNESINQWPSLTLDLWKLFLSDSNQTISAAYEMLAICMSSNMTAFQECTYDLQILFQKGLTHEDSEINRQSFKAFITFVENSVVKQLKQFKQLISTMFMSFLRLSQRYQNDNDYLQDLLYAFQAGVEAEPKFFASEINLLLNTMNQLLLNPQVKAILKKDALEIIISLAERTPTVFEKEHQRMDKLIEMIFYIMTQISPYITEQWKKPFDGYFEDDDTDPDIALVKFGQNAIDRLLGSFGYVQILPYLSLKWEYLLQQEDWRTGYAALMTLSQIGEYAELEQVKPFIEMNLHFIQHKNPKIRYAVLHMIGQLADDMRPEFQEELTQQIMTAVFELIQFEKVDRVQAHLCAMLANFWESTPISDYYYYPLFEYCLDKFKNGISITKENAITCIASISEVTTEFMDKKLPEFVPYLLQCINNYKSNKSYESLTGCCIECLTIVICQSTFSDTLQLYAQQTIQLSSSFQLFPFKENLTITKYVLSGWQRLSLKPNLTLPFFDDIVKGGILIIKNIMQELEEASKQEMFAEEDDEEAEQIQKAAEETLLIGYNLLNALIESFNQSFLPYTEQCHKIIFKCFNQDCFKKFQQAASETLIYLTKNLKDYTNLQLDQIAKYNYISQLAALSQASVDPEEVIVFVQAIVKIIEVIDSDFLTYEEVSELIYFFISIYKRSDERMCDFGTLSEGEDANDIKEIHELDEKLQVEATRIIQILLKTHNEKTILCQQILSQIKLPAMDKKYELSAYMKQFTLKIIAIFIEYIGFPKLGNKFNEYVDVLAFYSQDLNPEIRQLALQGIGETAKTQKDVYLNFGHSQISAIQQAISTHQNIQGKNKLKKGCLDSLYIALGKIIFYQPEAFGEQFNQMVSIWLKALPLKADNSESRQQEQYLVKMIFKQLYQTIISSNEIAQQTFFVLSEILYNDNTEDILKQEATQILLQLHQVQQIQNFQANLLDKVKNNNKEQMKALLNI